MGDARSVKFVSVDQVSARTPPDTNKCTNTQPSWVYTHFGPKSSYLQRLAFHVRRCFSACRGKRRCFSACRQLRKVEMAPKAKSKNYSTKQQRITLVNSSSGSSSISISSSGRSTSSAEITCVFIPIIQTEWQRSIWHPPLVWPPPGFDDDGEDMGMCGC